MPIAKRTIYILMPLLFWGIGVLGQDLTNKRDKIVPTGKDRIKLDSLPIIPKSLQIKNKKGLTIDTSYYSLKSAKKSIIWKKPPKTDTVSITYRVFPFDLNRLYKPFINQEKNRMKKALNH